jgi:hypothetical protein
MAIQVHLTSCNTQANRSDVDDTCLDFSTDQQNVTRRQFAITLPQSIRLLAQTTAPTDSKPGYESGGKGTGGGGGFDIDKHRLKDEYYRKRMIKELENYQTPEIESKKVKNANPNKHWLLKPDESFGQVFQKKIRDCPKQDRSFVCLKFWIKGECYKNCKFIHADLNAETKTAVNDWISKCRADFR